LFTLPGLLAALLAPAIACPTVATGTTHDVPFDSANVAMVRQGTRTTFTVSVNPDGEPQDMALLLPVPTILGQDDVRVIDAGVFKALEGHSGVMTMPDAGCSPPEGYYDHGDYRYDCYDDDVDYDEAPGDTGASDGGGYGSVEVESEYHVGAYEIVLLSSEDSSDLFRWLTDNGLNLQEDVLPILQDYIDQGLYFLVARVDAEAATADGAFLTPLQVAYDSELMTVPLRLAAHTAAADQDMVMYAFTPPPDTDGYASNQTGQVGIANYAHVDLELQCIWGEVEDDFREFYGGRLDRAMAQSDSAGWLVEWSGRLWGCSICSPVQLQPDDLEALGWNADEGGSEPYLTRLHLRYSAETATEDLNLYASGIDEAVVTTYADANEPNSWCIEACPDSAGETWLNENPVPDYTLDDDDIIENEPCEDWDEDDDMDSDDDADAKSGGCATGPGPLDAGLGLMVLGLAIVGRSRRSRA
jgi:hypothetical protein